MRRGGVVCAGEAARGQGCGCPALSTLPDSRPRRLPPDPRPRRRLTCALPYNVEAVAWVALAVHLLPRPELDHLQALGHHGAVLLRCGWGRVEGQRALRRAGRAGQPSVLGGGRHRKAGRH